MNKAIYIIGIIALLTGLGIGFGIGAYRSKHQIDEVCLQQITAKLKQNIIIADRLHANQVAGAQFLLEMDIDSDILGLDAFRREGHGSAGMLMAMQRGLRYRAKNPFIHEYNGVRRSPDVESALLRLLSELRETNTIGNPNKP